MKEDNYKITIFHQTIQRSLEILEISLISLGRFIISDDIAHRCLCIINNDYINLAELVIY